MDDTDESGPIVAVVSQDQIVGLITDAGSEMPLMPAVAES